MKSTKNLRLRLRLMEGALLLLLGVFTAAAVSTHQLLLDAANHPASDFDLTSPHVVGTLDPARLPADMNFNSIGNTDPGTGVFSYLEIGNGAIFLNSDGSINSTTGFAVSSSGTVQGPSLVANNTLSSDGNAIFTDGFGTLYTGGLSVNNGSLVVGGDGLVHATYGFDVGGGNFTIGPSGTVVATGITGGNPHINGQLYYDPATFTLHISQGP